MKDHSVPETPVPMLIYLGLELIAPSWFLAAAMLMCSMVSLSIGSAWATVGTVGLAPIYAQLGWFSRRAEPEEAADAQPMPAAEERE